jgi:hypothetical protein
MNKLYLCTNYSEHVSKKYVSESLDVDVLVRFAIFVYDLGIQVLKLNTTGERDSSQLQPPLMVSIIDRYVNIEVSDWCLTPTQQFFSYIMTKIR